METSGLLPGRRGTAGVVSIARSSLPPEGVGVVLLLKGKGDGKVMWESGQVPVHPLAGRAVPD